MRYFVAAAFVQLSYGSNYWPDSTLNVSQIYAQLPESAGLYVGSPSVVRMHNGELLASHDQFGKCRGSCAVNAFTYVSADDGYTWSPTGVVSPMYWATLFVLPGDANSTSTQGNVYCMGVTDDGATGKPTQISISRSSDYGRTWARAVALTASSVSYSTGPTPTLVWPPGPAGSTPGQRIYRAYEHNTGAGWGVGYASVVISAPLDGKSDLLSPSSWVLSGELPFTSVQGLVPANWTRPNVVPGYGWLEGGVVEPSDATDAGVYVILRVNSQPTANKAALLYLPSPTSSLAFKQWIDFFPGGMSKFDVRRDPLPVSQGGTGLYVTLSNNIVDDSATLAPTCSYMTQPVPANKALPCCGFLEACDTTGGTPSCLWCHAGARNNLTLSVSPSPGGPWRVISTVLWDDTGVPAYISTLGTGFQYVAWQFDEPAGDLIAAVRAGYRGSNNYHNANRLLFKRVAGWRSLHADQAQGKA